MKQPTITMKLTIRHYLCDSRKRLSTDWSTKTLAELIVEKQEVQDLLRLMHTKSYAIENGIGTLESDSIFIGDVIYNYQTVYSQICDAIIVKRRKAYVDVSIVAMNGGGIYCSDDNIFNHKTNHFKIIGGVTL